jgi:hypothetical protein
MNEEKLNLILQKLESLESGQAELQQITRAIRDRQEETDAKLEALSMDVNKIYGNTVRIEQKLDENHNDI